MISLTDRERDHFAAYLRQEAESISDLAKEAKKIGRGIGDAIAKKYRTEAMACLIVAGILTGGEMMGLEAAPTTGEGETDG